MDETVVNGAQLFFPQQFGISTDASVAGSESKAQKNQWILGLVTGAPYVSSFPFLSFHRHTRRQYFANTRPLFLFLFVALLWDSWMLAYCSGSSLS